MNAQALRVAIRQAGGVGCAWAAVHAAVQAVHINSGALWFLVGASVYDWLLGHVEPERGAILALVYLALRAAVAFPGEVRDYTRQAGAHQDLA